MSRIGFSIQIYLAANLIMFSPWVGGRLALGFGAFVCLLGFILWGRASLLRGRTTAQPKTAKYSVAFCVAGCALVCLGIWAREGGLFAFPIPTLVAGAGIWSLGIAMWCVFALWNGGWYVVRKQ